MALHIYVPTTKVTSRHDREIKNTINQYTTHLHAIEVTSVRTGTGIFGNKTAEPVLAQVNAVDGLVLVGKLNKDGTMMGVETQGGFHFKDAAAIVKSIASRAMPKGTAEKPIPVHIHCPPSHTETLEIVALKKQVKEHSDTIKKAKAEMEGPLNSVMAIASLPKASTQQEILTWARKRESELRRKIQPTKEDKKELETIKSFREYSETISAAENNLAVATNKLTDKESASNAAQAKFAQLLQEEFRLQGFSVSVKAQRFKEEERQLPKETLYIPINKEDTEVKFTAKLQTRVDSDLRGMNNKFAMHKLKRDAKGKAVREYIAEEEYKKQKESPGYIPKTQGKPPFQLVTNADKKAPYVDPILVFTKKDKEIFEYEKNTKNLEHIKANMPLGIIAHGTDEAPVIGQLYGEIRENGTKLPDIRDEETNRYTNTSINLAVAIKAEDLAGRLIKSGLPRDHKFIQLYSCHGGGELPGTKDADHTIFAKEFAIAMQKRGYNNLVVGGFLGVVKMQEGVVIGVEDDESYKTKGVKGRQEDANVNRVFFNGKGNEVASPFVAITEVQELGNGGWVKIQSLVVDTAMQHVPEAAMQVAAVKGENKSAKEVKHVDRLLSQAQKQVEDKGRG